MTVYAAVAVDGETAQRLAFKFEDTVTATDCPVVVSVLEADSEMVEASSADFLQAATNSVNKTVRVMTDLFIHYFFAIEWIVQDNKTDT